MSSLAQHVLDRKAQRDALTAKILRATGDLVAGTKGIDESAIVDDWLVLDDLAPGASDPDDDLQVAGLRERIRATEARAERLATMILGEGDHMGQRAAMLRDYEDAREGMIKTLRRLVEEED